MSDFIDSVDTVVIGSGLGGLSAAATLAMKGEKVVLIDSHDKVGGFATNYRRGSYNMEAGIHMMSGPLPQSWGEEVLHFFKFFENIELVRFPEFYQCHFDQEKFKLPAFFDLAQKELKVRFPEESQAIDQYFEMMVKITDHFLKFATKKPFVAADHPAFRLFFSDFDYYWKISIGTYLDSIFQNAHLKMVLLANVTFYHHNPYELSLIQFMISQITYLVGGCFYIKGGSQVFSNYLKSLILQNNGKVILNHKVIQLHHENQKVKEVVYQKVRGQKEILKIQCKKVISNAAIPQMKNWLSGEDLKNWESLDYFRDQYGYSTSSVTMCFGLKNPLSGLGNDCYMNLHIEEKKNRLDGRSFEGNLGLLDYDWGGTGLCKPGVYSCEAIYMDQIENWQNLDELQYEIQKKTIEEKIITTLNEYYPGFKNEILFSELSSPRTVIRYVHTPQGAIYGYHPSPESIRARSRQFQWIGGAQDPYFENVYYGGAWGYLPGFLGALVGGYKAALESQK